MKGFSSPFSARCEFRSWALGMTSPSPHILLEGLKEQPRASDDYPLPFMQVTGPGPRHREIFSEAECFFLMFKFQN